MKKVFSYVFVFLFLFISLTASARSASWQYRLAMKYFPNLTQTEVPKWQKLSDSCASAKNIQDKYNSIQEKIDERRKLNSTNATLVSRPEQIVIDDYENLNNVKERHQEWLTERFDVINSKIEPGTIKWLKIYVDGEKSKLERALDGNDFKTCVQTISEYLPKKEEVRK